MNTAEWRKSKMFQLLMGKSSEHTDKDNYSSLETERPNNSSSTSGGGGGSNTVTIASGGGGGAAGLSTSTTGRHILFIIIS